MAHYAQLELFDLENFTSQSIETDINTLDQIQEKLEEIDYQQLELKLFPKQINVGSFEYLKQAA